jgi:hypothetical protein
MASRGKGEACCTSVLGGGNDFDNNNYEEALDILYHQNKRRILEAKEIEKEGRPEIIIR